MRPINIIYGIFLSIVYAYLTFMAFWGMTANKTVALIAAVIMFVLALIVNVIGTSRL